MKIWYITGVALAALLLSSCGLLTDPSVDGSWQWFTVGAKRRDFGGFGIAQNGALQYYSYAEGSSRFDEKLNDWVSVETPGGFGAAYAIARDGTEFVTSYGIYTRASSAAAWTLIPGSRALRLQYLALDRDGSLYGAVGSFSTPLPAGSSRVYVKLKGSSTWTAVSGLPSSYFVASAGIDPIGLAYLYTDKLGFQFQGASAVSLPQPQAQTYDYAGNRYYFAPIGLAYTGVIQKVTASGTLEPWVNFGTKGGTTIKRLLGFGKDGRFYAIAGFNTTTGFGFGQYDIIAVSPTDAKWTRVASGVVDGAGNRTAPPLTTDGYNTSFAPDGSLYFYGCESGCTLGTGSGFSYGVYRLKF